MSVKQGRVLIYDSKPMPPYKEGDFMSHVMEGGQLRNAEIISASDYAALLTTITPTHGITAYSETEGSWSILVLDDYRKGYSGIAMSVKDRLVTFFRWQECQHDFVGGGPAGPVCKKCGRLQKENPIHG